MAAPTPTETWVFTEINQAISAATGNELAQKTMLALKNSFAALGWSVEGSSDSVTADTSDNWGLYTDCVWAGTGAHSWVVLSNATMDIELCIDLSNSGVSTCDIVMSRAGFTGYSSTSSRPTATDEMYVKNNGYWGHNAAVTQMALHVLATDEDGGPKRTYAFFVCQNGGTQSQCQLYAMPTTPHGEADDLIWFMTSGTTSQEEPALLSIYSSVSYSGLWNGDTGYYQSCSCTAQCFGGSSTRVCNSSAAPSDLDSGYPLDLIGIYSNDLGTRGKSGYLPDTWWGRETHVTGDCYPSGANDFAKFGAIVVPWGDNTAPNLGA